MKLNFVKMHGLGNDFILLDGISQDFDLTANNIRHLSHRKLGIGCDQLLIAQSPSKEDVDFRYRIFNSDGSEVEQCGNGARCFAQFVRRLGLTNKKVIKVETLAGTFTLHVRDNINVTVEMGVPEFDSEKIPFSEHNEHNAHMLEIDQQQIEFAVVSMGNPHAVIFVDDVDSIDVYKIGSQLEVDGRFPKRTNVQFIQIENRQNIIQRIFERGVGETMASGSGACAATAVAQQKDRVDDTVQITMPGGVLEIHRNEEGCLLMTGPTEFSFEGSVNV
ncbi:MAG: diaminopimelate epimerase [Gammaproteobacteria bacterium]|nr:diaminopimelate epimerase [Gammaproteobacteria bacterium]